MQYRFLINYTVGKLQQSLEVIKDTDDLTPQEARKRVEAATRPYGSSDISNISIIKSDVDEIIDTDPETSASE